jgi:hypothetical protein
MLTLIYSKDKETEARLAAAAGAGAAAAAAPAAATASGGGSAYVQGGVVGFHHPAAWCTANPFLAQLPK